MQTAGLSAPFLSCGRAPAVRRLRPNVRFAEKNIKPQIPELEANWRCPILSLPAFEISRIGLGFELARLLTQW